MVNTVGTERVQFSDIVDTAAKLFAQQGYSATSMSDLANGVGILKGSLYHHIESKQVLLYNVIIQAFADYEVTCRAYRERSDPGLVTVCDFVYEHVSNSIMHRDNVAVFHRDFRHLSGELRANVLAIRDAYDHLVRMLIDKGRADGSIRADCDPFLATSATLGMVNSVAVWFDPSGPLSGDDVAEFYRTYVLHALKAM